ncbi:hypothetical protein Bbelb_026410 [Branchiostoma belcheri]|nr:hypothetical protein Bbelb_026410 [Branchiostoma belcheri]
MRKSERQGHTKNNSLKWCGIKPPQLEPAATDRTTWRAHISRATRVFEEDREQRLNAARAKRHKTATSAVLTTDHQCRKCGRQCASSFGLRSHMRSTPPVNEDTSSLLRLVASMEVAPWR